MQTSAWSILYSLISPHPTSSSSRTRIRTPPTTIALLIRSYALCACALSQSSYNPFFPSVFCLVGLSSTSAALSAAEYYKRWRADRGFVNGRRDVCQLTDQRAVGTFADAPPSAPFFASPHISRHHLSLPRSPCLSLQMNGGLKISVLSPCRGRTKSSSFLCLSQPESTSLLFDDPVWFFLCARFVGLEDRCPLFFSPGQPRAWPPN